MARVALAVLLCLSGPPPAEADAALCPAAGIPDGGECGDRDHVLLQILEHDGLHKSVTRHRQERSCARAGCDPDKKPVVVTTTTTVAPTTTTVASTTTTVAPATTTTTTHGDGGQPSDPTGQRVTLSGRQILVDGRPLHIKGICWSPTPKGEANRADFSGFMDSDLSLMKEAGINVIRTYGSIGDKAVLDAIEAHDMWVVPTVYSNGAQCPQEAVEKVNMIKDHPAVLMWSIANEWNYNGIYAGLSFEDSVGRINEVVRLVKEADPTRPVSTVHGEVPSDSTLMAMPNIDVWGINSYRGISFGDLMQTWESRSSKPMYLGEFGADAYNADTHSEDQDSQALATEKLTHEIIAASAAQGGVCSGGFIFEFSDEWWKDGTGSPTEHDVGGIAPGGGPYPDQTFNEEWWGLVDVQRAPRRAFYAYAGMTSPNQAPSPRVHGLSLEARPELVHTSG